MDVFHLFSLKKKGVVWHSEMHSDQGCDKFLFHKDYLIEDVFGIGQEERVKGDMQQGMHFEPHGNGSRFLLLFIVFQANFLTVGR